MYHQAETTPTGRQPQRPRTHRTRYALRGWLALQLVLAALVLTAAPAQARPDRSPCVRRDLPVTLTPGPAIRYRLAGWLCQPRHPANTVQLLVAGLTYTHRYWTGPGHRTDQVAAALAAGNAVYMIDRIGTGASDRPPADQVTVATEATVTHQAVHALRNGTLGRYTHVAGVGHSYGSVVWMAEAATHHDIDALILTGLLHDIDLDAMTRFTTDLHPAADDPAFAHTTTPAGYLTTRPGSRGTYFLDPDTAVPGAAGWDETTKTTATTGELTFTPEQEFAYSRAITVPVLLVVGTHDALFCGAALQCSRPADICQRERGAFPASTALTAITVAATGHSINLHTSATPTHTLINTWLDRTTHGPAPASCSPRPLTNTSQ
ncbi:alpha/beta hydrolase [Actinoplanes sp. NPDC026619]|uniref:alpha/beta fold hydrolase n=1 Tax=Actinoplanes sp. NPDC026619 TaxID=3155798 RepID=UPI0033F8CD3C